MFRALANIRGANKWRKELAGTPTYFAAAMLASRYADSSIIGSFLVFGCLIVIYHYIYEFVFPKFESSEMPGKLIIFFDCTAGVLDESCSFYGSMYVDS